MSGQHSNDVKEDRSRRAIQVAEEMSGAYRRAMIGTVQEVLFEEEQDGMFVGHAPNYMKIYVKEKDLHNQVHGVIVEKIHKDGLFATKI
jgi:threonylcarbamoyladenosine tRNA methylthiotransferase MtaB